MQLAGARVFFTNPEVITLLLPGSTGTHFRVQNVLKGLQTQLQYASDEGVQVTPKRVKQSHQTNKRKIF